MTKKLNKNYHNTEKPKKRKTESTVLFLIFGTIYINIIIYQILGR